MNRSMDAKWAGGGGIRQRALRAAMLSSLVAVVLGFGVPVAARQGTDVPPPSACTIAPRRIPPSAGTFVPTIVLTPGPFPTPYQTPVGNPVAGATVQAIQATIREAVACANAGDTARSLALLSDRAFTAYLTGPQGLNRGILSLTASTPQPAAPADELALLAISDITRLSDGRAGATVTTRNSQATYVDYVILVDEHGRWLIDSAMPLATVPAGTPVATP